MKKVLLGVGAVLLAVGCASTHEVKQTAQPEKQTDMSEKSRKYLGGTKVSLAENVGTCAMPKVALDKLSQGEWLARLNSCVSGKNWDLTEQLADELAKVDFESPWPGYYRSVAAMERGDYRRALWMIDLAQKKVGPSELITYQKARVLLQLGQTKEAIDKMEKALESNPKMNQARLFLAQVYRRDRDTDRAMKHYEALLASDFAVKESMKYIADTRYSRNQRPEAVALYNKLIDMGTDDATVYHKLGQYYEENFMTNPQDTNSLLSAIQIYRKMQTDMKQGKIAMQNPPDLSGKLKDLETKLATSKTKKQASTDNPKTRGGK